MKYYKRINENNEYVDCVESNYIYAELSEQEYKELIGTRKVVINTCYGGFGLSEKAYKMLGLEWDGYGFKYNDKRDDPKLVDVVETLGDEANGKLSDLKIVEIPAEVKWIIEDYDGIEEIHEVHNVWC